MWVFSTTATTFAKARSGSDVSLAVVLSIAVGSNRHRRRETPHLDRQDSPAPVLARQ